MGLGGRWVSEGQNGGAAQLRTALENHGPKNDKAPAFWLGLRQFRIIAVYIALLYVQCQFPLIAPSTHASPARNVSLAQPFDLPIRLAISRVEQASR